MALALDKESTKQQLSRIDTAIEKLERYAEFLEKQKQGNPKVREALRLILEASK